MSVINAINNFYFEKEKRNWNKGYFFFDIHGTILKPNYKYGDTPKELYPHAKETLQYLSDKEDVVMILYTCSHPNEIEEYLNLFKSFGINFKYVNENPEVQTQINGYGCYDKKPYMNVLFEDKSGFDPNQEWEPILTKLKQIYYEKN
jgi:hypothetical protein